MSIIEDTILGFRLTDLIREGGEKAVPADSSDFEAVMAQLRLFNIEDKFRIMFSPATSTLCIKYPKAPHESGAESLRNSMWCYTYVLNGNVPTLRGILRGKGSRDVALFAGGVAQPDASFQVRDRTVNSVNAVIEVQAKNGIGTVGAINKATNYIVETHDVMVVLVLAIYENQSMVIAELQRNPGGGFAWTQLVSFGVHPVPAAEANHWVGNTGLAMTGVGRNHPVTQVPYPPCNAPQLPQYQFSVAAYPLLDLGIFGAHAVPGARTWDTDLFNVQQDIVEDWNW